MTSPQPFDDAVTDNYTDGFISMPLKRFWNMARRVAVRKDEGNLISLSEKACLWPRNSVGFVILRTQQAQS